MTAGEAGVFTAADVVLSQRHPTIPGRGNRYRERWALLDGRVYHVYADDLDGPWTVEDDTEHLRGAEAFAFVRSDAYRVRIGFTLAETRQQIADLANERHGQGT